ncbi:transcription factor TGA1-like isoform X3 [Punica granatum]|nr:transcription factor TGA1-like isoform X3 [Punica granatum]XP_031393219.1 transcription factor TGA1-like isoform X3 [Punica granatum]
MNSPLTHLAAPGRLGMYEPLDQFGSWGEAFKGDKSPIMDAPMIVPADSSLDKKQYEYIPHESVENSRYDQEASKPDKVLRRLAQNREAARKSRLRKKAYVQQLESSRLKLAQLEQELNKARHQGMYLGNGIDTGLGFSRTMNPGIAAFEMEYVHWVEEQHRKMCELRSALQAQVGDVELRLLVDNGLKHYQDLFRMKADAAKADVFYLMSGTWRTSAERFFLWIGGFRPSELLNVLIPQIETLTEQQLLGVCNLRHSSQQAEDALSQGMDKLQQTLAQEVAANQLGAGNFGSQVAAAMEKLEALENFVSQADHLRQQTMLRMSRILTTRQAARVLLALGEYFHRLRALSSLWAARPCDSTQSLKI